MANAHESELPVVPQNQLTQILMDHCMNNESVIVLGPPGCAKTEKIIQVANACNKPPIITNVALSDGPDFNGLPQKNEDGTSITWIKDKRWLQAAESPVTAFQDEIFQGSIQALNATRSLFMEKRLDDVYLHPDCWVVGASNRAQDKAGTSRVPGHFPQAAYMYEVGYEADPWVEYHLERGDIDMLTLRFIRMKSDGAFSYDPAKLINPTMRSWSHIGRKLSTHPNLPYATIAAKIGQGLAAELMAFRKIADSLPSRESILLTPKEAMVPEEPSALFLVADMLADVADVNTFEAIVEYMKRVPQEYQAKLVKDSMKRNPQITSTKAFVQWGVKFAEVLR